MEIEINTPQQAATPEWETKGVWAISTAIYITIILLLQGLDSLFQAADYGQHSVGEAIAGFGFIGILLSFMAALLTALAARQWGHAVLNVFLLVLMFSAMPANVC